MTKVLRIVRTFDESLFFNTLCLWIAAFVSLLVISYLGAFFRLKNSVFSLYSQGSLDTSPCSLGPNKKRKLNPQFNLSWRLGFSGF